MIPTEQVRILPTELSNQVIPIALPKQTLPLPLTSESGKLVTIPKL